MVLLTASNTSSTLWALMLNCLQQGAIVADLGCSSSVTGSEYVAALEKAMGRTFLREDIPRKFVFGSGDPVWAEYLVHVPGTLKGRRFGIKMHVVPGPLPPLLSKPIMKRLGLSLNLVDDSATGSVDGVQFQRQLLTSPTGHYLFPLQDIQPPAGPPPS